jgi:RNA polymerase sigma factor (sigma-70 family)
MRIGVDDEREVERYRVEDPVALSKVNELASKWLKWGAIWAARHYGWKRGRVGLEDIEQAGRMGVMFASREHDESKGNFPHFAKYFIKSECTKLLANGARPVSMPRDWKETIKPLMAGMDRMWDNGEAPNPDMVLNSLDLGETKRSYISDVYQAAGRMGVQFERSLHSGIKEEDFISSIDNEINLERVKEATENLPPMHKQVIKDKLKGVPVKETAESLGLTVQTIHTYRRNSIEWLRYAVGAGPRPREKQPSGNLKERIDYAKFA